MDAVGRDGAGDADRMQGRPFGLAQSSLGLYVQSVGGRESVRSRGCIRSCFCAFVRLVRRIGRVRRCGWLRFAVRITYDALVLAARCVSFLCQTQRCWWWRGGVGRVGAGGLSARWCTHSCFPASAPAFARARVGAQARARAQLLPGKPPHLRRLPPDRRRRRQRRRLRGAGDLAARASGLLVGAVVRAAA